MTIYDDIIGLVSAARDEHVMLVAQRDDLIVRLQAALTAAIEADADLTASRVEVERLTAALAACQEGEVDPPPPPPPPSEPKVLIGMSAPAGEWDARLREVGPVQARRLFATSFTDSVINTAKSELAAGRYPVLSYKVPTVNGAADWAGAAAGKYDGDFRALTARLVALLPAGRKLFVAVHHEPGNDGTPANYVAMQRHVLPLLRVPGKVEVGIILNSQWGKPVQTDVDIAEWAPKSVLDLCDVVAADIYQGGTNAKPLEGAGPKIRRMSAWADRVGVARLGIGEFNCLTATELKDAGDAILSDPRFAWALVFNSAENNRDGVNWVLTGDRLSAFKATLAAAQ